MNSAMYIIQNIVTKVLVMAFMLNKIMESAFDEAQFVLSRNASSQNNKTYSENLYAVHISFLSRSGMLCVHVRLKSLWFLNDELHLLHSILNPVSVDLTSKENIVVTSYTVISHSSPKKFLKEYTKRVGAGIAQSV